MNIILLLNCLAETIKGKLGQELRNVQEKLKMLNKQIDK